MDTSRVHRQPATAITSLSIDAAETADGVPEGSWVTHTAKKRTVYVATAYLQNVLSHILQNLRWRNVGRDPMGWMCFPWFRNILSFSARGINPGWVASIENSCRCGKHEKKYLQNGIRWLLSRWVKVSELVSVRFNFDCFTHVYDLQRLDLGPSWYNRVVINREIEICRTF